jgi:PilZ domain
METRNRVRAVEVIRDIRSGITAFELMKKYRLSSSGLRQLFRKLVQAKVITTDELDTHAGLYEGGGSLEALRRSPRTRITYPLDIYDGGNPFKGGRVLDVSQNGVRVEGVRATPGEEKTFLVRLGGITRRSFVFEAKCRWANRPENEGAKWVAGFEITSITNLDLELLRELLRH